MKSNITGLRLFYTKKDWTLSFAILFIILSLNSVYLFSKYQKFIDAELYQTTAEVLNIYPKQDYQILKFKADDLIFFSSVPKSKDFKLFDNVHITLLTANIDFISYLKGFYAQSFNLYLSKEQNDGLKEKLYLNIKTQHESEDISNFFEALFFAMPLNQIMREFSSTLGIAHLIAISGFHLGIISLVLYWIVYFPYSYVHSKYYPYRNKKFDILLFTSMMLLSYLLFTNTVPSLLRSFVMFTLALFFLRTNIKLISFETLLFTLLLIMSFFPGYIFSLSLWFSIGAVFYIFLFLHYFKELPRVGQFLLFNVWIFLVMNPISHYFFGTTSLLQLFSPLLTVTFTLFYPLEVFLHCIGWGGFLDEVIQEGMSVKIHSYEVFTPVWFFIGYILISFFSIWSKFIFVTLNILLIIFNIYLYSV